METTPHQIRSAIIERINHFRQLAEAHYGEAFPIVIKFDLKGVTAGTAQTPSDHSQPSVIRINMEAVSVDRDEMLNGVCPHEVAHVVQRRYSGFPRGRKANPSHGVYWKSVMRFFGVPATRCHTMPLAKARKTRQWVYSCGCTSHTVGTKKHNNIALRPNAYHCKKCRGSIRLVGEKR